MSPVDWETLGVQLLERERRPVLVLDGQGRLQRANRAFVFLLAEGSRTHDVKVRDEWVDSHSRDEFDAAFARALRGDRVRVVVSLVNTLFPLDLVLELVRFGGGTEPSVMAVMVDAVSRGPALPLQPVVGVTYEVGLGSWPRRVTRLLSSEPQARSAVGPEVPCWSQMFGRESECAVCPVRKLGENGRAMAVLPSPPGDFTPKVMVAERRGDSAAVTVIPLDGELYSALVEARVEHLAQAAALTPRERELLSLLLMGRSLDEVAVASGITARTAKYHQQNLLRKVGADSRLDLLRLLL